MKPFIYKYHVRVPEYAQRTGKRLFLQPGFFLKGIDPMFSAGTRRYPIYFHYPWSEEDKITIDLPNSCTRGGKYGGSGSRPITASPACD